MKEWFGPDQKDSPCYGRIITERHFDRLHNMLKETKGKLAMGNLMKICCIRTSRKLT